MRNPTYKYNPIMDADRYELISREDRRMYWKNLNKDVYRIGVENTLDYLMGINPHMSVVAELQVGAGRFVELLENYIAMMEYEHITLAGTETYIPMEDEMGDKIKYVDIEGLRVADVIFAVECLPSIDQWRDYLESVWNYMSPGAYLVLMDTQTPTQFRDAPKVFEGSKLVYSRIVEEGIALKTVQGRNRKLKIKVYRKEV